MRTEKDVEAYLLRARIGGIAASTINRGTFLVESSARMPPVAVRVDPPLVVVRVHIGDVPPGSPPSRRRFFASSSSSTRRQLVHASYGLDDERVVLSSALELENLDFNELRRRSTRSTWRSRQQLPGLVAGPAIARLDLEGS